MHKTSYRTNIKYAVLFISAFVFFTYSQLYAGVSDIKTEGLIESIAGDSLVVNGFIFHVNDETEVKDDTGQISFSILQVAEFVKIEGESLTDSHFIAEKIERENQDDSASNRELKTEGLISEIYENKITLNGYVFIITDLTEIEAQHGLNISFEDLRVDMNVRAEAEWQNDTALVAEKIVLRENDFENEIEFTGTIDSVLSNAITINNYVIQITSGTLIELRHNLLGTLQDLQAGMVVNVKAAHFDSVMIAIRIKVENEHENEIEITGAIDSVGADFINLLGYHIILDNKTEITNYAHDSLSISDLQKGLRVNVKGSLLEDNTIHARRIKVKRFHEQEIEFSGTITAINENQIQVEQTLFFVDSATIVLDDNNNLITLNQLSVGLFVEIKGRTRANGEEWALRIKIEDRNEDELEFTGKIENLYADSITVNGFTFLIDEMTIVLGLQGNPIFFSDLVIGDLVEIKGLIHVNGIIRAVRIKLEDTPAIIVVNGLITAISDDFISINGPQFWFTANSVILDENYQQVQINQYNTGQEVSLLAINEDGESPKILQSRSNINAMVTNLSGNNFSNNIPDLFELKANYPNPFNPETTISFTINKNGFSKVKLRIYDITGRLVKTLFNGVLDKGEYRFKWNGKNNFGQKTASGMYIYQLTDGKITSSRKMTLIQ